MTKKGLVRMKKATIAQIKEEGRKQKQDDLSEKTAIKKQQANRLVEERYKKNLKVTDVSSQLGVSYSTYDNYERGENSIKGEHLYIMTQYPLMFDILYIVTGIKSEPDVKISNRLFGYSNEEKEEIYNILESVDNIRKAQK